MIDVFLLITNDRRLFGVNRHTIIDIRPHVPSNEFKFVHRVETIVCLIFAYISGK